jgi:hypothetical protein
MKDELGQAAHIADMRNAYKVFIGNPKGQNPLVRTEP